MFLKEAVSWYKARTRSVSAPLHFEPPGTGLYEVMGEAMHVTVKLFATFRVGRFASSPKEYPVGTRIAEVLRELRIPEAEIGMIMVNSRHAEPDRELNDGDTLSIFPLVGGG